MPYGQSPRHCCKSELHQVAGECSLLLEEQLAQRIIYLIEVKQVVWSNLLGHSLEGEIVAEAWSVLNTINSVTKCKGMPPPSVFTHC